MILEVLNAIAGWIGAIGATSLVVWTATTHAQDKRLVDLIATPYDADYHSGMLELKIVNRRPDLEIELNCIYYRQASGLRLIPWLSSPSYYPPDRKAVIPPLREMSFMFDLSHYEVGDPRGKIQFAAMVNGKYYASKRIWAHKHIPFLSLAFRLAHGRGPMHLFTMMWIRGHSFLSDLGTVWKLFREWRGNRHNRDEMLPDERLWPYPIEDVLHEDGRWDTADVVLLGMREEPESENQ